MDLALLIPILGIIVGGLAILIPIGAFSIHKLAQSIASTMIQLRQAKGPETPLLERRLDALEARFDALEDDVRQIGEATDFHRRLEESP